MEKNRKKISIWRILAYFIIYSFVGYVVETLFALINYNVIESRQSFMYGPFCGIYGFGAVVLILSLRFFDKNNYTLFLGGCLTGSIVEYTMSFLGELLFNARWWDYSNNKFNINGRVCLETIVPFGILGLVLIYVINPFIFNNLSKVPTNVINIIAVVVAVLFTLDLIISLTVISNVRKATTKFDKENPKDSTDEISRKVREFLKSKSPLNRRLVEAFPELTAIIKERKEQIKQKTKEIKGDIVNKANEVRSDITDKAGELKGEIAKQADKVKEKLKKEKNK